MDVHLNPVPGADAEELLPILRDAEEREERLREALSDPTCRTFAALTGDRTVGAAVVRWDDSEPAEIVYIAVVPGERGRGHGRRIVAAVQADVHTGTLSVGTANSSLDNIAFYQKCGFRMRCVRRDFFDYITPPVRENGIVMRDMIVFDYTAADR